MKFSIYETAEEFSHLISYYLIDMENSKDDEKTLFIVNRIFALFQCFKKSKKLCFIFYFLTPRNFRKKLDTPSLFATSVFSIRPTICLIHVEGFDVGFTTIKGF